MTEPAPEANTRYTLKQRLILALAPPIVSRLLRLLLATCRWRMLGREHWDALAESSPRRIVALWHEALGLACAHHRGSGYHTLTSLSFDGELAARFTRQFGLHAVRGSSSRGGSQALQQLAEATHQGPAVGFTLDGPKGPRRVAKPGIAILAVRTSSPVIPLAYAVSNAWRLKSWDQMPIPKPFSTIIAAYGPPVYPPDATDADAITETLTAIETALGKLQAEVEAMVASSV